MVWWTAAVCAFFIKGLCGFANTLVFTTILSFAADNARISPVELLLGYPSNLILMWKERRFIRWKLCLPLSALVTAGSIPGILFLKNTDAGIIKVIFGVVIFLLGLEMLLRELRQKKVRQSRAVLMIVGVLSGLLCGLYGVGALLGAYLSRVTEDSASFKANICVVFLVENTLRIFLYALWGILTVEILKQAVLLLPFMLAGLGLGMLGGRVLDEARVKKCVTVMLMLSGAALILR
nr:sulfite exporter TauE/SafE family protein [uncultured Oscillibacter sp.]